MVIEAVLSMMLLWSAPGKHYYCSAAGNDAAAGDKTHPFRSLQRVARLVLKAGDTVSFQGGEVFSGTLRLRDGTKGMAGRPIVITSHGRGKAVIDGGNGSAAVFYKTAHVDLSNLEMRGAGRKEGNKESGLVVNTCREITADSLVVHGFQKSGVYVYASAGIRLSRILARENGFAGISADGPYGKRDCHHLLIRDCRAENNPGDPTNLTNHSGNGIVAGFCRNVVIEQCTATGNGWDMPRVGNGPVGIWAFEADSVIIRHCISFRNRTARGAADGGGFDLDGGVSHSVIEHCLSYENEGSGFGLFQYAGASPWHDNSVHDCVSNNDGLVSEARAGVFIWNSSRDTRQLRNCSFYNNIIYNTKGAVIHYAGESEHSGFHFHHNAFITADSLIKGQKGADDVFEENHWTGLLPDSSKAGPWRDTGSQWLDTDGHPINAHGAGVLFHEGVWYLYGEIKKGPTHLVPGQDWEDYRVDAGGVSCYASRDLVHWKYEGVALASERKDSGSDLHISRVIERPKVVYNAATRQFVMWMHIDKEDYSYARAGVAVSDRPEGPYRYIRSIRPDGEMSRDMTLFKDDDGRAYLVYTSENNNTLHVSLLTPDYLAPAGVWKRVLAEQRREAPAVFKYGRRYYLITSLCTGWDPNAALYATADSMLGEWHPQGNPCKGPDAASTFHSQSTYVLPVQPSAGKFLFMADRWNKTDLERSGYCWLPLQVKDGVVEIRDTGSCYGRDTTVLKQLAVGPLSIVEYKMELKGTAGGKGVSFLQCFDSAGRLLLQYDVPFTLTGAAVRTGNYTETPPHTARLTVGLLPEPGVEVQPSACEVHVVKDPAWAAPPPVCDLPRYLRPFWRSDTIFNETVLLSADGRSPAAGQLLFEPGKILSVTNFGLDTVYRQGRDYRMQGRGIQRMPGSAMPFRADTSFDRKNDLAWYDLQSQWITVTYTHRDTWTGPAPTYKGSLLPRTMEKLRGGRPVTIVAYGMSITRGMDVSGYDSVRPYMPTYMDLFARGLRDHYVRGEVKLYNAGLPGATVAWGAEHAEDYISPLHPDLAVIDFGMNDFWRMSPGEFRDSVQTIIRKVRTGNPAAELILLANMPFDPDYVLDSDGNKGFYQDNMTGYSKMLRELEGQGIAVVDMHSVSEVIYRRKKAKDCLVNPLHPNDYLARWYAQGLLASLVPTERIP